MTGLISSIYEHKHTGKPNGRKQVRGRKDKEKQEKVVTLEPLRERLTNLITLHAQTRTASAEYSEAIKATAEATGLMASVVRSYVTAKAAPDGLKDAKRKAEQLALVFGEDEKLAA